MAFLDFFRRSRQTSASVAKDRLQIIVARERASTRGGAPDYLPQLQQELLQVIAKYESIDIEKVSVSLENAGDCDVLELNIALPDAPKAHPIGRRGINRHAAASLQ